MDYCINSTLCDHLRKTSRHPIFMTLGNIPLARHNKIDAKILLGYIPNLESYNVSEKQSTKFRIAIRKLFHHALATLLKPLKIISNTENIKIRNENDTKDALRHGNDLKYGSGPIKILEKRLSQIPRYPNFKIFKNGFERLNRLTTSEYRYLMKIMLLVLDELILDKKLNKNLCNLYFLWIDMYMEPLTQIY
ncbi:hypothetical protein GLOIN_2v1670949 [Rhizophagus irregularis DAOM 181602=DAOM 197198]|nr:hypothetical protein GLOIN_2v1670949 [Rhizophagus irregularis DAOM 181602=DAOM 197198]